MITIHVYCSYRLSPVGYRYGILRYPVSGGGDFCSLSPPGESVEACFVKTAFDNGFITNVRGKIPGSTSYVFLVKRYYYAYPKGHPDIGEDVHLNIAFEFDKPDEYMGFIKSFQAKLKDDEAELKREMADMIHPDYAVPDYALNINRKNLVAFMDEMLDSQSDAQPSENTVFSVLSAQTDYSEELERLFNLDGVYRPPKDDKKYVYHKKKVLRATGQPYLPLWLILILILITLLGVFLLTLGQKKEIPNQAGISVQEEAQTSISPDEAEYSENTAPEILPTSNE